MSDNDKFMSKQAKYSPMLGKLSQVITSIFGIVNKYGSSLHNIVSGGQTLALFRCIFSLYLFPRHPHVACVFAFACADGFRTGSFKYAPATH